MSDDHPPLTLDEFLQTLGPLGSTAATLSEDRRRIVEECAAALQDARLVDHATIADLIREHPDWVPVLGLVIGLSQEQLKNQLRYRAGTSAWKRLAVTTPTASSRFSMDQIFG